MSSIAHCYVSKQKVWRWIPSLDLQSPLAAMALRIPAWGHPEDRPGQGRDFQSDFGDANDD
jgi:hypothetical protein